MNSSHGPRRPADNPFASHRVEGLGYRCQRSSVEDLCRRLEELGGRAAIVGPKGSGKTTLLQELALALRGKPIPVNLLGRCARPWRTARGQLPRRVQPSHVVLVDGAEKLEPIGWRLLLRAARPARSVVVTLHHPGRLPTLVECRTDHRLLRELVTELAPAHASALEPGLEALFQRHGGNIRLCFRELYDVFAGRPSGSPQLEMNLDSQTGI